MKIAFYTQGASFDGETVREKGLGGSESAVFYMARELAGLGHEVGVFNNCDRPGVYEGVGYKRHDQLIAASASAPFDICVFSRYSEPLAEVKAERKILWLHDIARVPYYQKTIPPIKNLPHSFFVVSRWQKNDFMKEFEIPDEKFYVTRNGVDISLFDEETPKNKLKFIYASTPFRGLDVLLYNIFPQIKKEYPQAELYLYTGMSLYGWSLKDDVRKYQVLYEKARMEPGVHLRVPVSKKELARELLSSSLLLYPAHFEEVSCITALEAQAGGTPVITSNLAALPETVVDGETGILIPIDDPESKSHSLIYQQRFVEETVKLLKDEERWKKMGENGKKRIRENFSWTIIAKEWAGELERLLNSPPSPLS